MSSQSTGFHADDAASATPAAPVPSSGGENAESGGDPAAGDVLDNPLALANQLCFSLSVASRVVVQSYRPVLEPLGLTHPQYLVMLALWDSHPRTVKDLSAELMQESATLSPLLKRLEARGLVRRDRDPDNERALAVTLTPAGERLRSRAQQVPLTMMQRLDITAEHAQELNAMMREVIRRAGVATGDPAAAGNVTDGQGAESA